MKLRNKFKTFITDTKVKDFCNNIENGNRVVGFFQIKKSYICELTFNKTSYSITIILLLLLFNSITKML